MMIRSSVCIPMRVGGAQLGPCHVGEVPDDGWNAFEVGGLEGQGEMRRTGASGGFGQRLLVAARKDQAGTRLPEGGGQCRTDRDPPSSAVEPLAGRSMPQRGRSAFELTGGADRAPRSPHLFLTA
jgi:hypothetical protein